MQKEVIILPNKKDLSIYEKYNLNTFLLPLKDYSIGYNTEFSVEEINCLSEKYNIYVLVNKFLHLKISDFKEIYPLFNENVKFIVEDIGLNEVIDKDRLVLYENHIVSNYKAINYLNSVGFSNIVINNDLTINEIDDILENCEANLYYFYVSKNMLMYSRRNLVSNYNRHFKLDSNVSKYDLKEKVSKQILEINDFSDGSVVRWHKIFCASKYIDRIKMNRIFDFTDIDSVSEEIILSNIDSSNLCDLIDSDYYFLENDIKYKVGDLK